MTFIEPDGACKTADAEPGQSLKDLALQSGISGIVGLCGGFANCGTCHVYVADKWVSRLPPVAEDEDLMLEGTSCERRRESRLSCQLQASDELDGIIVQIPDSQM